MERIRAFIAIELPGEVKRALAQLQDRLRAGCKAPVRWAFPDAIHLTLKFLGDIDFGIISDLTEAMAVAARGIQPFHLAISKPGIFPDFRRVRVIWVGLMGDLEKLDRLQKNIESSLAPLGFTVEARPFIPHLTLGRVRDHARPDERQQLGQLVSSATGENECKLDVNTVQLMRSQLTAQGPIYTRIGSVELK